MCTRVYAYIYMCIYHGGNAAGDLYGRFRCVHLYMCTCIHLYVRIVVYGFYRIGVYGVY